MLTCSKTPQRAPSYGLVARAVAVAGRVLGDEHTLPAPRGAASLADGDWAGSLEICPDAARPGPRPGSHSQLPCTPAT